MGKYIKQMHDHIKHFKHDMHDQVKSDKSLYKEIINHIQGQFILKTIWIPFIKPFIEA